MPVICTEQGNASHFQELSPWAGIDTGGGWTVAAGRCVVLRGSPTKMYLMLRKIRSAGGRIRGSVGHVEAPIRHASIPHTRDRIRGSVDESFSRAALPEGDLTTRSRRLTLRMRNWPRQGRLLRSKTSRRRGYRLAGVRPRGAPTKTLLDSVMRLLEMSRKPSARCFRAGRFGSNSRGLRAPYVSAGLWII